MRLRPPGPLGKWTDAATPEHGDFNDDLAALGPLTGPGPWAAPATLHARNGARQVP